MISPTLPSFASPSAAQQALLAAGTDPQQYLTFYVGSILSAVSKAKF